MWLSAETMRVPRGHGLVAACGHPLGRERDPDHLGDLEHEAIVGHRHLPLVLAAHLTAHFSYARPQISPALASV